MFEDEIKKLNLQYSEYSLLQCKDDIYVYRVINKHDSYILKIFSNQASNIEIQTYALLHSLGIPCLRVFGMTDKSILMEDILKSSYRLCVEEDYKNPYYVESIAVWFKCLHQRSFNADLSSYTPVHSKINAANLFRMRKALNLNILALDYVIKNIDSINNKLHSMPQTLLHNDCGYNNSAFALDGSSAIMFDYNYMSKGAAYWDVMNFMANLNDEMKKLFLVAYGEINTDEKIIIPIIDIVSRAIDWYDIEGFSPEVKWCLDTMSTNAYFENLKDIFC